MNQVNLLKIGKSRKRTYSLIGFLVVLIIIMGGWILYAADYQGIRECIWRKGAFDYVLNHKSELEKFVLENVDYSEPEEYFRSVDLPNYHDMKVKKFYLEEDSNMYVVGFSYKTGDNPFSHDYCEIYYSPDNILCGIWGQGEASIDVEYLSQRTGSTAKDLYFVKSMVNNIYRICDN